MCDERFYINDEHICDSMDVLSSFWVETYSQAKEICSFLNAQEYKIHTKNEWDENIIEKFRVLTKENQTLKKILKESYINEICENCKYAEYSFTNTYWSYEGDLQCLKKHTNCDGLKECNDFELKLKR